MDDCNNVFVQVHIIWRWCPRSIFCYRYSNQEGSEFNLTQRQHESSQDFHLPKFVHDFQGSGVSNLHRKYNTSYLFLCTYFGVICIVYSFKTIYIFLYTPAFMAHVLVREFTTTKSTRQPNSMFLALDWKAKTCFSILWMKKTCFFKNREDLGGGHIKNRRGFFKTLLNYSH